MGGGGGQLESGLPQAVDQPIWALKVLSALQLGSFPRIAKTKKISVQTMRHMQLQIRLSFLNVSHFYKNIRWCSKKIRSCC